MPDSPAADPDEPSWWQRLDRHLHRNRAISLTTKIVVTVVGSLVLTAGLIMMVTPGPGLVGIVAGLAILATEWEWADRWVQGARHKLEEARDAAAALDPAVRRRRVILTAVVFVVVVGSVLAYLLLAGWPEWAIWLWDGFQSVFGFLPDLPGM